MRNRKIGQFIREYDLTIYFTFLGLFLSLTALYAMYGVSVLIKSLLLVACMFFFVIALILIFNTYKTYKEQELENKKKQLQKLIEKYRYYVNLVNRHTIETFSSLTRDPSHFDIDYNRGYLFAFSDNLSWICNNVIVGKPDSFIIATCLLYSILSNPVIICSPGSVEPAKDFMFNINLDMAMHCAFEIISEPITYFENDGNLVEEKHPRKEIVVPIGLIKNSPLRQRILNSICCDELSDDRTSIIQFSNLLHLLFLSCP